MKQLSLYFFLFISGITNAQIFFEEVTPPNDFNLWAIQQSPTGELFVQADNDHASIYTSMDGQTWAKTAFPINNPLYDIQFYNDGTPLLKPQNGVHLIRRNNNWHIVDLDTNEFGAVEASFIKNDTLFVYHEQTFSYSIDKGVSFTNIFTFPESISDHSSNLWKIDNHFILYHTAGASRRLSIFNKQGERIYFDTLDISTPQFSFNNCGEVVILDGDHYYLINNDISIELGNTSDLIPNFVYSARIYSDGNYYYYSDGNTIYKSEGCNINWIPIATDNFIEMFRLFWVTSEGSIFLFNNKKDHYWLLLNGSTSWIKQPLNINFPHIEAVNEAPNGNQIVLTTNALFSKNIYEEDWTELEHIDANNSFQIEYAPNSSLYINTGEEILYSEDNGHTISVLNSPEGIFKMRVLSDGILFIWSRQSGEGAFYSINNGESWTAIPSLELQSSFLKFNAQIVDQYIYIADLRKNDQVLRINMITGDVDSNTIFPNPSSSYTKTMMLVDGTIYYFRPNFSSPTETELYRYQFGLSPELVDTFSNLGSYTYLLGPSSRELIAFNTSSSYYIFNEGSFDEFIHSGLPSTNRTRLLLAESKNVYDVKNYYQIFRTTTPITAQEPVGFQIPQTTYDISLFPNPTTGNLYFSTNQDLTENSTIEVINYLGQLIIPKRPILDSNMIDISSLVSGIYFLRLRKNGILCGSSKFVKL